MTASCSAALAVAAAALLAGCGANGDNSGSAEAQATAAVSTASTPTAPCPSATPAAGQDDFCRSVALHDGPNGLRLGDISVGTGAVASARQTLTVQYTGWLENGTVFDSSRRAGSSPFSFVLGQGSVIRGWDVGLVGMRVGGRRRLVIPPLLAYGSAAQGPIPPNSTLVFDVELVSIGAASASPSPAATATPVPGATPTH